MILVDLEAVAARRPDRPLFEELSLTVHTGDRLGVVGRNGAGKSTLLRLVAGRDQPEEGTVRRGSDVRVGFLAQRPVLPAGSVRSAVGPTWQAAAVLERLGMGGLHDADVSTLSGGQAKRVALARVLVEEVDLLVLDEPTNHLDLGAIAWLEEHLAAFRGGLVVVTHDRYVLDRVTTRILELNRGRGFVHEGGYSSYLAAGAERAEQEARAESVRRNLARAELAWLRRGAPARTRKPKAHIAAANAIVAGGPSRPDRPGDLDLTGGGRWGATPRLGDQVLEMAGVGFGFGGARLLFRDLDLNLGAGDRLGVVGPNGAGKSTLLDLVAGRRLPSEGKVLLGQTVRVGYYDQTGRELDPALRVREAVAGSQAQPSWEQTRLMEQFWFDADAQWAPVATLSGGEQRRLQLLLVLAALPNVLLLDEPSNDLDLDTLRALEGFLETWPGTVVVASHDRAFLGRTVEDVLVLDGRGGAALAAGGYAGYAESLDRGRGSLDRGRGTGRASPSGAPRGVDVSGARGAGLPGAGVPGAGSPGAGSPGAAHGSAASLGGGPGPAATGGLSASPGRVRSPSTLRRLVSLAEREITETEEQRDRLVAEMATGDADYLTLDHLARTLADTESRLATAEERWLALAEELGI